ncbi:MAG: transcription antitermination factor NusB [SAR324 cluster bacterium]|nr:transcription antitermination factor NusB [SAR324 cluster bacterium]MBL7035545.1 transcription antitermination factor NusB [SAR324 cluster bacterium]
MRHQARAYTLQALYQAEMLKSKAMIHVDRFLDQLETSPEIKTFARELTAGTLQHRKHLDRYLRLNLEHWKLSRLSITVRNILRLAVFELYHYPELSHSVVINEAVELCKDFVDDTSHGLTNSVLQRVYDQITLERKTKAIAVKEEPAVEIIPEKTSAIAEEEDTAVTVETEKPVKENPYRKTKKPEKEKPEETAEIVAAVKENPYRKSKKRT